MKHQFITVWHSPADEKQSHFAAAGEVIQYLEREYGISARVAEKSIVPQHIAIEVPFGHRDRASDVCSSVFGRHRHPPV